MPKTNHRKEATDSDDRTDAFETDIACSLEGDAIVLYDRENSDRWIQSSAFARLDEVL